MGLKSEKNFLNIFVQIKLKFLICRASKLVTLRMFRLWLHPDFIYKRTKMCTEETKAQNNSAFSFADKIIKNVREKINNDVEDEEKKMSTFLRALVNPKFKLSEREIVDEVKTLLIAVSFSTNF